MTVPPMRLTTLRILAAAEVLWLVLVAYSIQHHFGGSGFSGGQPWDVLLITIAAQWAAPAIALVVVAWLIDQLWPETPSAEI